MGGTKFRCLADLGDSHSKTLNLCTINSLRAALLTIFYCQTWRAQGRGSNCDAVSGLRLPLSLQIFVDHYW